ncbi:AAA family ATPase [uncultured Spirosoma sp.]|uniref:AAA family ATPase n=1 Tax=uncultured Spirosoma sp. TaxID=278208 RepID=UPI00258B9C81|nr:AAA family ATPase [uncultured Spirosoma sp.]
MKINRLVIENFKSIERIELIEPNPFTVFVGPNGSGKSNIFEALEFFNLAVKTNRGTVESLFGGKDFFLNRKRSNESVRVEIKLDESTTHRLAQRQNLDNLPEYTVVGTRWGESDPSKIQQENQQLFAGFSHLFIGAQGKQRLNYSDDLQLTLSGDNFEKVLKRILAHADLRNELFEWLDLFVPGFKSLDVVSSPYDGRETLLWFEKSFDKPFTKDLISDGTYNILALLTAVYQSDDKPQFLCIEEPENGMHPQVLMSLVNFLRQQCEEKGHYIWLNTHSESLVRGLTTDEIILVNKVNGATQTRQIKGRNLYDLPTDEAWLTGALGGGLPW